MDNFLQKFRKIAGFPFVFLFIMMLFLGAVLGTAGSTQTTGEAFELQYNTDTNRSWIIFKVSAPMEEVEEIVKDDKDGKGKENKKVVEQQMNVLLHDVYINIGAIYSKEETATMELQWGSSSTEGKDFFKLSKMKSAVLFNEAYEPQEGDVPTEETEESKNYIHDAAFEWIAPFGVTEFEKTSSYRKLDSPIYFRLVLPKINKYQNSNVLINEIVFVGEKQDDNGGTGEYVVLNAEIDPRTAIPSAEGEEKAALKEAEALIDAQELPARAQSSYYRYGAEEKKMLSTFSEMKAGNRFIAGDTYVGDKTYNSLGLELPYLGTLMFGTSPFGLRFFNALASFGILVVGFFFVKRLFKSDKAGLSFAIIYALCGVSISLAHLSSPIMAGVFFLLASLAACYRYFDAGMKKPSPLQTVPLFISGIAGALAVTVHGAFVVPVAGVAVLFAFGAIKQHWKNRARLNAAIDFAEEEKAAGIPALSEDGTEESEGNKRVRVALATYRYDTVAAASVFVFSLLVGIFVFSVLLALPVSYATNKIYNGVTGASPNLFSVAYTLFSAGFGKTSPSGWSYLYPIFTGTGEKYAVTLGIMNFAASLLGLLGLAFAVYRIVMLILRKTPLKEYVSVIVPLAGFIFSLITASFAGGAVAFVLLANLFAFALVSGGAETQKEEGAAWQKAVFIGELVALALLIVCFALTAVFTFSVPLPSTFLQKIF